jgi:hypothetical protein
VPAAVRYEAGVLTRGRGALAVRADVVYGASWSALCDAIRRKARSDRARAAAPWVDALLEGLADGSVDLRNARQFARWVVEAGAL